MVRIATSNPIAFNQRRIELRKAARSHAMHVDIEILIVKKWINRKIMVDDLSACSFQDLTKKRARLPWSLHIVLNAAKCQFFNCTYRTIETRTFQRLFISA